ncbi:NPCBM/NEW2 domain-containing protein [Deinococcus sp. YIM 77859]|uniref:NPCBM/NEW2 domain-containing protein n=1 Tax=Deinococcus sp. YIM 77859 TaxID=1540221 RepID=UPI00055575AD|nr:NPCBM/NEW2 domain-containing protein [Deinococcus sp. YIM 77859]
MVKHLKGRRGAGRIVAALVVMVGLGACNQVGEERGPYAGGVSYPWQDRLDPPGPNPYANGRQYAWQGVRAASVLGPQAVPGGDNYLSDVTYTSATNSWGPIEKDRSNGEQGAGDGRPLTLNGQTYTKGLGVHAHSELVYTLTTPCTAFTASVGVDDEVGSRGSVIFQVYGDGRLLYDSGRLTGASPTQAVQVDLSGVGTLRLVVTDGGDNIDYDHADWADAKVSCAPPPPPSTTSFLSDLGTLAASNGWGPFEKDRSNGEQLSGDGRPLTLNGQTYTKGLGVHAHSSLRYALGGNCTAFTASVGVDDEVGSRGSVIFQVYTDGTLAYQSPLLTGASPTQAVQVDVSGKQELRLVVTDGGDNIDYDHADWADAKVTCGAADTTPPAAPTALSATGSTGGITLDWNDNSENDLAGYRVLRSASAQGPFTVLTPQLLSSSFYTDTAAPQGTVSYYQVVAVDKSGNVSAPATANAARPSTTARPRLELENLDRVPFPDRLVFSRIGSLAAPPSNGVHDVSTVRVRNTGTGPLQITDLPVTGPWVLEPRPTLPVEVPAGGFLDVRLRFRAETTQINSGTLTVVSNDPDAPSRVVQLAGLWQIESENNKEPLLTTIVRNGFGYQTVFPSNINQNGRVAPQGDEVISAYWQRADAAQPVTVYQLAAYHTQGSTATLRWHAKGSSTLNTIMTHAGVDGQTVLPRLNGSNNLAAATFTPTPTFGFKVDGEWSDPVLNQQSDDLNNGCTQPCGQHLRFFAVKDRNGQSIPDTYLLGMDYSGINYDYNDNVYLIRNIRPAPILIDTGTAAGAQLTDPEGNVWFSDRDKNNYPLFTPTNAINEPATASTVDIRGTENDALYRTYRGNVGSTTPRSISYTIPLNDGTYQVKLHFADLAWNVPGKRVFDVMAEGQVMVSGLDIVARAGGGNTALVVPLDVRVTGGALNLTLTASVDYPSIAGIEILR